MNPSFVKRSDRTKRAKHFFLCVHFIPAKVAIDEMHRTASAASVLRHFHSRGSNAKLITRRTFAK